MTTTTDTPSTTCITDLTDAERTVVLRHLLEAHPDLFEEAEQLAAAAASDVERDGLAHLREEAGEETLIGWGDVREHTHALADWARRRAGEAGIDLDGTDTRDGS